MQFYDHLFDWGLKEPITELAAVRSRNSIHPGSSLRILAADWDLYVAQIDENVIMKIGPKIDVGNLIPSDFVVATHGNDYCVWEKKSGRKLRP
jgi:alpha-amylase